MDKKNELEKLKELIVVVTECQDFKDRKCKNCPMFTNNLCKNIKQYSWINFTDETLELMIKKIKG